MHGNQAMCMDQATYMGIKNKHGNTAINMGIKQ